MPSVNIMNVVNVGQLMQLEHSSCKPPRQTAALTPIVTAGQAPRMNYQILEVATGL